jgi:uncharacterized protein (DUF58 family)
VKSQPSRFDPESLQRLNGLLLRGKQLIAGFLAGSHQSDRRGQAIEFSEHRPYATGDDPRRIDWRVLARRDEYFVKEFEDETNLICGLVLDNSASMLFRSQSKGLTKSDYSRLIGLTLAQFLFRSHDAVALSVFNDDHERFIEPTTQSQRWLDMVDAMDAESPRGNANFEAMADRVVSSLPSRSLVILISDFLKDPAEIAAAVRRIRSAGNEVIFFQVLDRAEIDFPFSHRSEFIDLETRDRLTVNASAIAIAYRDEFALHQDALLEIVAQADGDYCRFVTAESLASILPAFVSARQRGRRLHSAHRSRRD